MGWESAPDLLRDASARPYIPYNFLRDLDPICLRRLDNVLERHLAMDENRATNGSRHMDGEVLCRYEECLKVCPSSYARGQHERQAHGKAKSNGK